MRLIVAGMVTLAVLVAGFCVVEIERTRPQPPPPRRYEDAMVLVARRESQTGNVRFGTAVYVYLLIDSTNLGEPDGR